MPRRGACTATPSPPASRPPARSRPSVRASRTSGPATGSSPSPSSEATPTASWCRRGRSSRSRRGSIPSARRGSPPSSSPPGTWFTSWCIRVPASAGWSIPRPGAWARRCASSVGWRAVRWSGWSALRTRSGTPARWARRRSSTAAAGDWARRARELAPEGYAAVFDACGYLTLRQSYDLLAPGGKLAVYGFHAMLERSGRRNPLRLLWGWLRTPRFSPLAMTVANRSVLAANLSFLGGHAARLRDGMLWLLGHFAEGRLVPLPVEPYPLEEVIAAHRRLESGGTVGKIVLVP
ncbi:MAG: zinc-binding dehydrogenase [Xanthomonadales bacterium]|nr:zinc-binding dehydrogenase [Xanthomonadales bacterium]